MPTPWATFESHGAAIDVVLSDNGREFRGRPDGHPYEVFLQLRTSPIRPRKPAGRSPTVIVERLHRTLLDEHFRIECRRTWFETIEEMQAVLDVYLDAYNHRRPHEGRGMHGRISARAFIAGLPGTSAKEGHAKTPASKAA